MKPMLTLVLALSTAACATGDEAHDLAEADAAWTTELDPTVHVSFSHAGSFLHQAGSVVVADDPPLPASPHWPTVPIRSSVYFPADSAGTASAQHISTRDASYPVVVVIHGNSLSNDCYRGFDYLLEHLARNGFIAASIFLNKEMGWHGRAEMALRHLQEIATLFGSKADLGNVALIGHSRGGSAAVLAATLNHDDDWGYGIRAVVSIAPSGEVGALRSTPYLVIYGSMDGDGPSGRTSFGLYDRATGDRKSMAFVHGATHERFNTVMTVADAHYTTAYLSSSDQAKTFSESVHQSVAKGYINGFLRWRLRNEASWQGIFRGEYKPQALANLPVYLQFEDIDTRRKVVDHFEGVHWSYGTAGSWTTSTIGGQVATNAPALPVENEAAVLDSHAPHDTAALLVRWSRLTDVLRFDIPAGKRNMSSYEALSFRAAQKVDSTYNQFSCGWGSLPCPLPQDFRVRLTDGSGNSHAVQVSDFGEIPVPHRRSDGETKSAMSTVWIPLSQFVSVNAFDVASVTFEFGVRPSGELLLDTLEFSGFDSYGI